MYLKKKQLYQRRPTDFTLEETLIEVETGKVVTRHLTDVMVYEWINGTPKYIPRENLVKKQQGVKL